MADYKSEVFKGNKVKIDTEKTKNTRLRDKEYLDVWQINPSYKDITRKHSIIKTGFLFFLGFFYFISIYIISRKMGISIISAGLIIIIFILIFHEKFFSLKFLFQFRNLKLFSGFLFWQCDDDPSIVFYTNYKDLITIGLRIFSIQVVPENIHANLNQFIKALGHTKVPFTYQITQKPLFDSFKPENRHCNINSSKSYEIKIYFAIYYDIEGNISYNKLLGLLDKLNTYTNIIKSDFVANFHHFKISMLSGKELINGLRASFLRCEIPVKSENSQLNSKKRDRIRLYIKALFSLFILISIDMLLSFLKFAALFRILSSLIILGMLIYIWGKDLLFRYIKKKFFKINGIEIIDPFSDLSFFRVLRIPDTVFFQTSKNEIGGFKMLNLKYLIPPPICFPSKYYISLMKEQIPFTTTVISSPMHYYYFDKEGYKYLKQKEQRKLMRIVKNSEQEENWLLFRSGIWKTILVLSTSSHSIISSFNIEKIYELESQLQYRISTMRNAFEQNFYNFKLEALSKNKLISGILSEILKNRYIFDNGTHLNYLLFQGRELLNLIQIADEFKKGIQTRIAAEFNSPLQLENLINIGNTINTEFLEEEIPVGLTLEQLHSLLITNGSSLSREITSMKIALELIKIGYPSVIFDFTGNWSKLINVLKDSIYSDKILYFKLARTFNLDPFDSDIPFDKENINYLNYMFDGYALCFKKDERTMELFRNTIIKNARENVSHSSINLDLKIKPDWEKSPIDNTLISFFDEFTQQDLIFFHSKELKDEEKVKCQDFITSEKTIIIDLSHSKDFNKQCFFMMTILSKILHYINSGAKFIKKFLFIPHIDIIFDNLFLDTNMRYGKIDKFLSPLFEKEFGLICTSSQAHYLHPNLFNHFENFITFKATDKRDIKILSNQMSLEELHGIGYYSKSRNEAYQIRYLMSMKHDEAIMKRDDLYQSFPIKLDFNELLKFAPLEWEGIIEYMGQQGYDLEYSERKILEKAKKTLLEKDFGDYCILVPEIVKFLENLTIVDQIGNLYLSRIKEELKKVIYPKISKITKNKKRIKEIRDEIVNILIRHDYLVENHPLRASGSESLRTSYSVGSQYKKALEDYYQSKQTDLTHVTFDVIEADTDALLAFEKFLKDEPKKQKDLDRKLKDAIAKEAGDTLYWELFQIHKSLNRKDFHKCIEISKTLLSKFLFRLYNRVFEVDYAITYNDIMKFINFIGTRKNFPYSKDQLNEYFEEVKDLGIEEEDLERMSNLLYKKYSEFFTNIQKFIYISGE